MAFSDFHTQTDVLRLLQRSLERGRIAHAYLFTGPDQGELEAVACALAKALNCENPPRRGVTGLPVDSCDHCPTCKRITGQTHPDVLSVRPESKSRIITIEQVRELMHTVHLKPTEASWKVTVVEAADRMNAQAANAFLKTLEEPPANSVLILLSADPQRLLETILSRCLRLNFSGELGSPGQPAASEWLEGFARQATGQQRSLLNRYELLSVLLNELTRIKESVTENLSKKSPLETYSDVDPKVREKLEDELAASIEGEYRRRRTDLLSIVQSWMRDIWLTSMEMEPKLLTHPALAERARAIAKRIGPASAQKNLQLVEELHRTLTSNVQEALALEVGLLRLSL